MGDPPSPDLAADMEMPLEERDNRMDVYIGVMADDPERPVFDLTQDLLYKVFSHLDAEGLCSVAQVCRQWGAMSGHDDFWHTLDFTKRSLSERQIADVCRKFPKASTVYLRHTVRLDNTSLQQALGRLRSLTSLHIQSVHDRQNSSADSLSPALAQHCPNLRHLSLNGVMLLSATIAVIHPKLETLELVVTHSTGLHVACPALKTLNLLQHVELAGPLTLVCPLLETADVSGCNKLTDVTLRGVLVTLSQLRSLNVTGCALVTDDTMRQVSVACTKLERLNASHCPLVTFSTVRFPALLEFTATNCESVSNACVHMLGSSLYLERLTLDYCWKLGSLELELYYLQTVSLFNCRQLSEVKLRTPRLSSLGLGSCGALRRVDIYSGELRALSLRGQLHLREVKLRGPELTSLDLTECDGLQELAGEAFMDAEACPKLTSLVLDNCEGLAHLSLASPSLSRLSLAGCSALRAVSLTCPSLTSLQTDGCCQLASARLAPVALADVNLGTCPYLATLCIQSGDMERLDLRGCGALEDVSLDCPAMTTLDTSYCSKLSSQLLAPMAAKCGSLSTLILAGAAVSADGLLALSELRQLVKLDLSYTEVDSLAAVFSACTQLKVLLLSACKRLPDSALEPLHFGRHIPQLEELDVSYCNISVQAVGDLLARARHIAHLSFNGCSKVDDSIWDRLAEGPGEPTEGSTGAGDTREPTRAGLERVGGLSAAVELAREGASSPGIPTGEAKAGPDCPEAMAIQGVFPDEKVHSPGDSPEHSWVSSMQSDGVAGSPGKVAKRLREVCLGDSEARGEARQRHVLAADVSGNCSPAQASPSMLGVTCATGFNSSGVLSLAALGPGLIPCGITNPGVLCHDDVMKDDGCKEVSLSQVEKGFPDIFDGKRALPFSAPEPAPRVSGQAQMLADVTLSDVEPRGRRLTSLSLVGCKKLREVRVADGTRPALTDLNVSLCESVREVRVAALQLTQLNLNQCLALTSADVDCPNLRTLKVQGSQLDDSQIRGLVRGCPGLESLDVRGCGRLKATDVTLTLVREVCPALRCLQSDAP